MKKVIHIIILGIVFSSCNNEQKTASEIKSKETQTQEVEKKITKNTSIKNENFEQLSNYPIIKDSVDFIKELREVFELKIEKSQYQKENEKITFFKKVKVNGSDKEYFFVEYKWGKWFTGCMATYPWKHQVLMTKKGKLVKKFCAERFDFVNIMDKQNPCLLIATSTARGNGGHEIYKFIKDSLINVCEHNNDSSIQTIDGSIDPWVYEPNELKLSIKDINKDGFKDLVFSGKLVLTQGLTRDGNWYDGEIKDKDTIDFSVETPFIKIPIELFFIYDRKTEHFKVKEDYNDKFMELIFEKTNRKIL